MLSWNMGDDEVPYTAYLPSWRAYTSCISIFDSNTNYISFYVKLIILFIVNCATVCTYIVLFLVCFQGKMS